MSKTINSYYFTGGGGGGGDTYAFIVVTYPAGSTCTATDGVTTLTAQDTSGSWVCKVPNAGTWTITSTDGTYTKSAIVVINSEGQRETVTIIYRLYIIQGGIAKVTLTPTGGTVTEYSGYLEWRGKIVGLLKAQADLTDYSKMVLTLSGGLSWHGGQTPGVGTSASDPSISSSTGAVAPINDYEMLNTADGPISAGQWEVNVSGLTGTQYLWLSMSYWGGNVPYIDVVDWYLE